MVDQNNHLLVLGAKNGILDSYDTSKNMMNSGDNSSLSMIGGAGDIRIRNLILEQDPAKIEERLKQILTKKGLTPPESLSFKE